MTPEEAYDKLLDTIQNNLRHPDYERVTKLADTYRKYNTGIGIDKDLVRFSPREEQELFEQRIRLTIPVTPAAVSSIKKPYNKVPRTQPVTRKITARNEKDKTAVEEIENAARDFYGGENNIGGLDFYFQNRFPHLSFDDPNMWLVVIFDRFDSASEKPKPKPFEVTAHMAINFEIKNNVPEWLIVQEKIFYKEIADDKIKLIEGKRFSIWAENDSWSFEQVSDDQAKRIINEDFDSQASIINLEHIGSFIVQHFKTNTDRVPAFRIGYIYDIETNCRTFVNPYHDALCFLEQSIQDCSEFCLSKRMHVFPQKIVRTQFDCPGERGQKCIRGYLADGALCGTCKGSGRLVHTSAQDMIEADMPDRPEELIPLSEYIAYVQGVPIDLLRLQKELVEDLKPNLHQTVFNSTVLLRKSASSQSDTNPIDATATEIDHDMESVYDTLTPFAEKISSARVSILEIIAILTENKDKVTIIDRPATKFKLKTRQDLYNERRALKESGAPAFTIDTIDDELAQDIYADDANGLLRYMIKKEHYPFIGKNEDEIMQLLGSTTVLKKTKVLWNYFDEIFTVLEREYKLGGKDFYLEKVEIRQQLIDEKVQEIINNLGDESQTAFTFNDLSAVPGGIGQSKDVKVGAGNETILNNDQPRDAVANTTSKKTEGQTTQATDSQAAA